MHSSHEIATKNASQSWLKSEGASAEFGWFPGSQWIGFLGKIETGNQPDFPMKIMGVFSVKIFPYEPIH